MWCQNNIRLILHLGAKSKFPQILTVLEIGSESIWKSSSLIRGTNYTQSISLYLEFVGSLTLCCLVSQSSETTNLGAYNK